MAFKVWEKLEEVKKRDVYFRIKHGHGDDIVLQAVDEKGNWVDRGNILVIKQNGLLHLCSTVNEEIGLQLDTSETLKLDDDSARRIKKQLEIKEEKKEEEESEPGFISFLKSMQSKGCAC